MSERVKVIWANKPELGRGRGMREHSHTCYQLYYVISGAHLFTIDGARIKAEKDVCFVIPPFTPHCSVPVEDAPLITYEIKLLVNDEYIKENIKGMPAVQHDAGCLKPLFSYIVDSWNCPDPQNTVNMDCILSAVLTGFFVDSIHFPAKQSHFIVTDAYNRVTKDVIEYTERNFSKSFSLGALARELNYNKNYLCTVFSGNTGVTIIDYVNFLRVRQAVVFFVFYGLDVFSACESSGFSNPSHFSRTFKAMTGVPPRSFRQYFAKAHSIDVQQKTASLPLLSYTPIAMKEAFRSLMDIGTMVQCGIAEND